MLFIFSSLAYNPYGDTGLGWISLGQGFCIYKESLDSSDPRIDRNPVHLITVFRTSFPLVYHGRLSV